MLRRRFMQLLGISLISPLLTRKAIAQTPARKIQLQEFYVAGYQYHDGMKQQVDASMAVGQELCLVREANNPYDGNAIAIVTLDGHKLGYVPRDVNVIPASMADQKVTISAVVSKFNPAASTWERLEISSYMEV